MYTYAECPPLKAGPFHSIFFVILQGSWWLGGQA